MADMFRLDGKVIAVLGAGSGIGEAVARGAAAQGAAFVGCFDMNEAGARGVADAVGKAGPKSESRLVDVLERLERSHQQPCGCQQDDRQRDLGHDQP